MIERSNYYLQSREVRVPPADMITTLAAVTHASLFGAEARHDEVTSLRRGRPRRLRVVSRALRRVDEAAGLYFPT